MEIKETSTETEQKDKIQTHEEIAPVLNVPRTNKTHKNNFQHKNNKKTGFHLRNKEKSYKNPRYFENKDFSEEDAINNTPSILISGYNELFYILRQKYTNNTVEFFECLEKNLKEFSFGEMTSNEMSLFSYACLYEKDEILNRLSLEYAQYLKQEDFEKFMIPICLNKNLGLLELVKNIYESHFSNINGQFTSHILECIGSRSYRDDNNHCILSWLEPYSQPQQIHDFWENTFKNKNISLIKCGLEHTTFKNYLKEHFNDFLDQMEKTGHIFTIKRKIQDNIQYSLPMSSIEESIKQAPVKKEEAYLSDAQEQLKNLSNEVNPTIIIKKKKRVMG